MVRRKTDRLRSVLQRARESAAAGRTQTEPEHLLLEILRISSVGTLCLAELLPRGADLTPALQQMIAELPPCRPELRSKFSLRSTAAITRAPSIAEASHHNYVGTEHLLVALLADEQIASLDVLKTNGVTHATAAAWVAQFAKSNGRSGRIVTIVLIVALVFLGLLIWRCYERGRPESATRDTSAALE